jgi:acyl-CoA synthetase (NDP forming)
MAHRIMISSLAGKLLRPASVAIVGASGDLKKNNSRPQRFLRKHGYAGRIYPINPREEELFGEPCHASLAELPEPPDHALVMVPAAAVEGVIRQCAEKGVAAATIFAGGFAESGGEGRRRQDRLVAIAHEGGVRLIGPNSLGIIQTSYPLALSASAALEQVQLHKGRVGVVSQSGSLIGALVSRAEPRGLGFSTLVSIGNECDLSVGEVGEMLIDDPGTDVLVLFLETLRNRPHVDRLAERAHAAGKPVLAYLLGRSDLGRTLAQSHTGAMVGEAGALDAYLASRGIARINLFESIFEAPALLAGRVRPKGRHVAIFTTTGGGAAIVADHLGERGVEVVGPAPALREALRGHGLDVSDAAVLDLTMAGTREAIVDTVMQSLVADARIDAIVTVVGSTAQSYPEMVVRPLVKWAKAGKPIVAFLFPEAGASLRLLAEAGIAGFRTPEACADALAAYLDWPAPEMAPVARLPETARNQLALVGDRKALNETEALALLASLGVPVPRQAIVKAGAEVPDGLAYPVVAKILSKDIAHKSEAGGVRLGIGSKAELEAAIASILAEVPRKAPGAAIDGVLVAEQVRGVGEAIVGYRLDPLIGPMVVAGMGGVLAEVYRDITMRPAPVGLEAARAMIGEVNGFAPMRGFRGLPEGDLEALARIVVAVSGLAAAPAIAEAEINPVIVRAKGEGAMAADGLVVLHGTGSDPWG